MILGKTVSNPIYKDVIKASIIEKESKVHEYLSDSIWSTLRTPVTNTSRTIYETRQQNINNNNR